MKKKKIGEIDPAVKIAAGLFWADYGELGAQVDELTRAGVDWIHLEMRDGVYMDFAAPRGGIDILEGIRPHTGLEIEVQIQMMRPNQELFRQLKDYGADLISLPIETTGEMLVQNITYIKETLELKVGVWAWQGCPLMFFEQYLPFVDIIEYESRAPFWKPTASGKSPHTIDPIVVDSIGELHRMLIDRGLEDRVELMEDGGLNADNVEQFVKAGMTVGEFSSPLFKGPEGRYKAGTGEIIAAVQRLRDALDRASGPRRAGSSNSGSRSAGSRGPGVRGPGVRK
jgi:ribulose-phosphate 3-epimerase